MRQNSHIHSFYRVCQWRLLWWLRRLQSGAGIGLYVCDRGGVRGLR